MKMISIGAEEGVLFFILGVFLRDDDVRTIPRQVRTAQHRKIVTLGVNGQQPEVLWNVEVVQERFQPMDLDVK